MALGVCFDGLILAFSSSEDGGVSGLVVWSPDDPGLIAFDLRRSREVRVEFGRNASMSVDMI